MIGYDRDETAWFTSKFPGTLILPEASEDATLCWIKKEHPVIIREDFKSAEDFKNFLNKN